MKKAHTEEVFFLTFNISKLHIESIELPITPSYNKPKPKNLKNTLGSAAQ
jgi:hypothetical protein